MENKVVLEKTKNTYGFLWARNKASLPGKWHFNAMQESINEPIVRGSMGIDAGSGCGYDTCIMAKAYPSVKIVSVDLSSGVYRSRELNANLENVSIIQGSILATPLKDNIFDFAYSYGVLHHTGNPKQGLLEIARVLKKDAPAFLYLYEDHSENTIKYVAVKLTDGLRRITLRFPSKIIYTLSCFFAPIVYVIFTIPSKIFMRIKRMENFARGIPFSFGSGFFSLRGDLFDRFSAPIEHRFSRQEAFILFRDCGFYNVTILKLKERAGWVVRGYKK